MSAPAVVHDRVLGPFRVTGGDRTDWVVTGPAGYEAREALFADAYEHAERMNRRHVECVVRFVHTQPFGHTDRMRAAGIALAGYLSADGCDLIRCLPAHHQGNVLRLLHEAVGQGQS